MIAVRIDSEYLALAKNFSFGYNFITNALNVANRNENSFALPISVPMDEHTAKVFGYSFDPSINFDLSQTWADCALVLFNNDFWQGAIELSNINDKQANIIFRFASGYIPTVNQKTKLRDFFLDKTINITGNTTSRLNCLLPLCYN